MKLDRRTYESLLHNRLSLFFFGLIIAVIGNKYITFFFKTGGYPLSAFRKCGSDVTDAPGDSTGGVDVLALVARLAVSAAPYSMPR